jgi:glutamine phosphoribosylpyrophosphate amidotransferase
MWCQSLIKKKYHVQDEHVAGKTIIMVDEALIRGDTSENVTNQLMEAGPAAVHWAIGSPPIIAPNYCGMSIDSLEELAFWHVTRSLPNGLTSQRSLFKLSGDVLKELETEIASFIKAASVT